VVERELLAVGVQQLEDITSCSYALKSWNTLYIYALKSWNTLYTGSGFSAPSGRFPSELSQYGRAWAPGHGSSATWRHLQHRKH
jgi:hypothetical protein